MPGPRSDTGLASHTLPSTWPLSQPIQPRRWAPSSRTTTAGLTQAGPGSGCSLGLPFPFHFCRQLGSSLALPWGPALGWLEEMLTQVGKVGRGGFLEEVALDAGSCGL